MKKTMKTIGDVVNETSVYDYEEESLSRTIPSYIDNCLVAFGTSLKKLRNAAKKRPYESYAINAQLSDYLSSAMRRVDEKNKRNRKNTINKSVENPLYNPQVLEETLLVVKNFVQENFSSIECSNEVDQVNGRIEALDKKCDEMINDLTKIKRVLKKNKITIDSKK